MKLRAWRKKIQATDRTMSLSQKQENSEIDHRFRTDEDNSREDLLRKWGAEETKPVRFFDEVDKLMEDDKRERAKARGMISLSLLGGNDETTSASKIESNKQSIFDTFSIPAPEPRSPDAFDKEIFDIYAAIVDQVLADPRTLRGHEIDSEFFRPIVKFFKEEEVRCKYSYATLDRCLTSGHIDEKAPISMRTELQEQRDLFMETNGINSKQHAVIEVVLAKACRICAKNATGSPILILKEKLLEAGADLKEGDYNTYLYVANMYEGANRRRLNFSSSGKSGSTILDILDPNHNQDDDEQEEEKEEPEEVDAREDIANELATIHDVLYGPSEQSVRIRIASLVEQKRGKEAEALIEAANEEVEDLRLRAFFPVLRLYCEEGDMSAALKLYAQMRKMPFVYLDADTYIQLIAGAAEHGYFRPDSLPLEGNEEIGFPAKGPELFNALTAQMAEDIVEISAAGAKRLYNAIEKGNRGKSGGEKLQRMHLVANLRPDNDKASDGEIVASRVGIDKSTGVCPRTSARLRLIKLEEQHKEKLVEGLLELTEEASNEFLKKTNRKKRVDLDTKAELIRFMDFLNMRKGSPFTAIVDGPNVAYYSQNFDEGKFNLYQIDFVVGQLESMGEFPLVILPFKYSMSSFFIMRPNGQHQKQRLNPEEKSILSRLSKKGQLYIVPTGCHDDHYWMYASISKQSDATQGASLDVPAGNKEGRWPGTRPMLVSNDQMRDHKLSLIAPRLFRRWYSSHIVNFNFTGFVHNHCVDDHILFSPADFFSREIQGNSVKNSKGIAEMVWHFPVSDWDSNERMCIKLKH